MPDSNSRLVFSVHDYDQSGAQKVVFFFCPFGIPNWSLALPGLPIWRLRRRGYRVISYSYKTDIATKSVKLTIDNLRAIIDDAASRMADIPPSSEIVCFGTSMGTVLASNVAARNSRIKKVILNLSYADISDHIVNLPAMRTIWPKRLKEYLETTESEATLRTAFDPYSPLTLVDLLKDKRLLIYASRDDRLLQLIHTRKLHDALEKAGTDVKMYQNPRGGHYFAALINYLRFTRWLRFLEQN
jgi:predicted esterase